MPWMKIPDGRGGFTTAHVRMSRKPRQRCVCGRLDDLVLCDWPTGNGRSCSQPACRDCSTSIGPDLDYCKEHAEEWLRRQKPSSQYDEYSQLAATAAALQGQAALPGIAPAPPTTAAGRRRSHKHRHEKD